MLELCVAVVSDSTAVLGHTIGRTATVATGPMVAMAVLHLLHEVVDRARSATVTEDQDLCSLPRVVKSRATKISMLWAEVEVVS
jgi:hypothetical protein